MRSIWNDADARDLRKRIAKLLPDALALWGKFNAPQMVCHLTDGTKMAMGELAVAGRKLPIRYFPLKQLILYVLPFPKGAPTGPELIARRATEWSTEVAELERALDRLLVQRDREAWPDHPAFGPLSRKGWGSLVYRHTDHHLPQFGV
jgi:hypothetical protein